MTVYEARKIKRKEQKAQELHEARKAYYGERFNLELEPELEKKVGFRERLRKAKEEAAAKSATKRSSKPPNEQARTPPPATTA